MRSPAFIAGMLGVLVIDVLISGTARIRRANGGMRARLPLLTDLTVKTLCGGIVATFFAMGEKSGFLIGAGFGLLALARLWIRERDWFSNHSSESEPRVKLPASKQPHFLRSLLVPTLGITTVASLLTVFWLLLNRGDAADSHQDFVRVGASGPSGTPEVSLSPAFWVWAVGITVLLTISVFHPNKWVKGVGLVASIGALSFFPIKSVKLLDHIADKIELAPHIDLHKPAPSVVQALETAMRPCVISGLKDARHQLSPNLDGLKQDPAGCFTILTDRLKQDPVAFLIVIGRADKRP